MTALPGWLTPLPDAGLVREADRLTIEEIGIPGIELMERAAEALVEGVFGAAPDGRVLIVAGKGNNGGDGLAAARLLRERGRDVVVQATCSNEQWVGDSALMLKSLPGVPPQPLSSGPDGFSCVVDCILGTGASGAPHGAALDAITLVNQLRADGAAIVACDVPSGVDASTGEIAGAAVMADLTVTFHAMKPGLWVRPGKAHVGVVHAADIGIPSQLTNDASVGLIKPEVVAGLPQRGQDDDKFSAGSVIVVGGSPGLTGAPILASLGAARGGAGYVTAALPESLLSATDSQPEIMGLALVEVTGSHCEAGINEILGREGEGRALVVGPGLGRSTDAQTAVRALIGKAKGPVVLDADGLNAFAGRAELISDSEAELVLTPHVGEMAALLGTGRGEVEASRLACVQRLAKLTGAVVVLKGDDSLVATPDGLVAVSEGGAPALATAGSGDVLSGLIGGLLARGADPFQAACAGVLIHLVAGRVAAEAGTEGVLAGDIAAGLPAARNRLASIGR